MWNKKRLCFTLTAVATGLGLLTRGAFFLVTAQAAPQIDPSKVVGISLSQGKLFAGARYIHNIAPGDTETDQLEITNTGTQSEWITISHTLTGGIFQDNGKTGTKLGTAVDPNDQKTHGISIDYAKYGTADEFDNHPLGISYKIETNGSNGLAVPIAVGPFSTDNVSPGFQLASGQTATVTYTYSMPLSAHNDYQGTQGVMELEITALGDGSPPPPPPPGGGTPPPPPGGGTPPPPPPGNSGTPTPPVVPGGTTPVTGLPTLSIVFEGFALFGLGFVFVWMARKSKR